MRPTSQKIKKNKAQYQINIKIKYHGNVSNSFRDISRYFSVSANLSSLA